MHIIFRHKYLSYTYILCYSQWWGVWKQSQHLLQYLLHLERLCFCKIQSSHTKELQQSCRENTKNAKAKKAKEKKRQWGRRENQCLAPGEQRAHVRCQTGNTFLQYLRVKCFIRLLRHWERMCMCMICTSEPWINIFKLLFISSLSGGRGDHFD